MALVYTKSRLSNVHVTEPSQKINKLVVNYLYCILQYYSRCELDILVLSGCRHLAYNRNYRKSIFNLHILNKHSFSEKYTFIM